MRPILLPLALLALTVALAACGGDGGDGAERSPAGVGDTVAAEASKTAESTRALCAQADKWREAAQQGELAANTQDRSTTAGRAYMNEKYRAAFSVVLPAQGDGDAKLLVSGIQEWNRSTEELLASLPLYYSSVAATSRATQAEKLALYNENLAMVLHINDTAREVNSYLASVCQLPPLDPYAK